MASPDKKVSAKFNLESPNRTRSEKIELNGSPPGSQTSAGERSRLSWSRAQSKIENPEKTRSNWSRAVQSPDANVEQDHAVRIILILKIMIFNKNQIETVFF